jgi:hypothetical protein
MMVVLVETGIGMPIGIDPLRFRQCRDAGIRRLPMAFQVTGDDAVKFLVRRACSWPSSDNWS